jgi:hypothetical protein
MTDTLKKNKDCESLVNNYMISITNNCEKKMPTFKNRDKVNEENINIPTINNYDDLLKCNYNLTHLKNISKIYKLKVSGNKNQLLTRIYSHLYFSSYIIKIQRIFRGRIVRKYKFLHGPACLNRNLCTNTDDFITMEPLNEISFHQFMSYKDEDGFVYGFNIISLYNLFLKSKNIESVRNPYNRNVIPETIIKNIKSIIKFSNILKIHIDLDYEDDINSLPIEKVIELRSLSLFQNINALGNYSESQWFLSLTKLQLIKYIKELEDIWIFRAQINQQTKNNICPPYGNPFRHFNLNFVYSESDMSNVRKVILEVLEKFVNNGIDQDSKYLGACYVLGALTIVNENAATSLPWLYQSFGYF